MSENTNSMFWIICGAVIVLGIFLLLNGTMDSTITGIFNHFKTIFTIGG